MKRLLFVVVFLSVLLMMGAVANAVTMCLESVTSCNDIKLFFDSTTAGVHAVRGYEYGCGYSDRELFGTLKVKSGTWYLNFTKPGYTSNSPAPFTSSYVVTYNPTSKSGTYNAITIYSSGPFDHTGSYNKIACPAGSSLIASDGASDGADENDIAPK
jgi:hypothetical protein